MLHLPDSEYCSICDDELKAAEKGDLQCSDFKCFALESYPWMNLVDTEVIEDKHIEQLTAKLDKADFEFKILEQFEKKALESSKIKNFYIFPSPGRGKSPSIKT